jgi:ribosome-interacting GTPase 1
VPANLSPEYLEAEERYKAAKSTPEKIAALEEMLSAIPKHKGTEKMQGEIKRKLSRLRGQKQKKTATKKTPPVYLVEKEGAGQVALVGPPNSGKSSLVRRLTHATPEVADYPFTTRLPLPAMMPFENIQIQLLDLPPLHPDSPEKWMAQAVRNADAAVLVVDLGDDAVLEQLTETLAELEKGKIAARLCPQTHPVGGGQMRPAGSARQLRHSGRTVERPLSSAVPIGPVGRKPRRISAGRL